MAALNVTPFEDIPAVALAGDSPGVLDNRLIEDALSAAGAAHKAAERLDDDELKEILKNLAWAVDSLGVLNRQLMTAIYRGNIAVKNYPVIED